MIRNKMFAIPFIIFWIISFYSWIIIFKDNEAMRLLGARIFPLIGGTVSLLWVFGAYRLQKGAQKTYQFVLTAGMSTYLLSNLVWTFIQMLCGSRPYSSTAHFLWIASYVLFLSAMIYKYKVVNELNANSSYLYGIYIFMIVAISLITHYLIDPIAQISNHSSLLVFFNLAYPIVDLVILFMSINIYYLSQDSVERKLLLTISIGFIIQIMSDVIYAYLVSRGEYMPGSLLDPLWLLAILMIGLSSLYNIDQHSTRQIEINEMVQKDEGLLLNLSVLLLALVVIQDNDWKWNSLVTGLVITISLIIFRQIGVMKRNRELLSELWHQAYHDQLTGLKNRASFQQDVKRYIGTAQAENSQVAFVLIDLDHFKDINDTLGHMIGDRLLIEVATLMKTSIGKEDGVYRMGGDEFIIILPDTSEIECEKKAERILSKFETPIQLGTYEISITPSIGISMYPNDGTNSEELLQIADITMYQAKSQGRNNYQFYNSFLHETVTRRMRLEKDIKKAIALDQLALHYQPKVDLNTRNVVGMEALLRWRHPALGVISPAEFIPIAEDTGQIVALGEWILRTACNQLKRWQAEELPPLRVSVNVSVKQLQYSNFKATVKNILDEADINPQCLELEITESIMQNSKNSIQVLTALKDLGVNVSIDDFGTGFSSLHSLQNLPVDAIKIDKSFVDNISFDKGRALLMSIIDMCHHLHLYVIVEGIEEEEQVRNIGRKSGILAQGYLFGKPMPAEEFIRYVSEKK